MLPTEVGAMTCCFGFCQLDTGWQGRLASRFMHRRLSYHFVHDKYIRHLAKCIMSLASQSMFHQVPCVEFTSCHASCLRSLSQWVEMALQDNNNASDHELKFYGANGHA